MRERPLQMMLAMPGMLVICVVFAGDAGDAAWWCWYEFVCVAYCVSYACLAEILTASGGYSKCIRKVCEMCTMLSMLHTWLALAVCAVGSGICLSTTVSMRLVCLHTACCLHFVRTTTQDRRATCALLLLCEHFSYVLFICVGLHC